MLLETCSKLYGNDRYKSVLYRQKHGIVTKYIKISFHTNKVVLLKKVFILHKQNRYPRGTTQPQYCNHMSPPAETYIVFPPCMSVRPCVRASVCLSVTLSLSEPYLQEPFVQKNCKKNWKMAYLLKLCNKKSKFNFAKNFGSFGQKTLFEFVFYPGQISVTVKDRDTKIVCSVSKNIPIV